jgi:hypothetical protein
VGRWLQDLNSLLQVLEEVKALIAKLDDLPGDSQLSLLASLQTDVDVCSKDVHAWETKAGERHLLFTGAGSKRAFKKLLVAINKRDSVVAYLMLSRHRENITAKLALVGR